MTNDALIRLQKMGLDDSTAEQLLSFKDDENFLYDSVFKITDLSENSAGQIKPVKPKRNFLAECVANFIYNFVEKSFLQL